MTKRLLLLTQILTLALVGVWAQGPNNSNTYYQSATNKKGEALKTALFNIIKNPSVTSYDGLLEKYKQTDTRPDGYVRDWYSNTTNFTHIKDKAGNYTKEGDVYNREHLLPQSWFGSGDPKSDIIQVVPTDGYVNNRRGNYPFGENNGETYKSNNGYSKLGACTVNGYSDRCFEPNDEVKGDIARIYFYMATCYQNEIASWSSDVINGTAYQPFAKWHFDMLVRWSKLDPVDEVEIARNNACYEVQHNRNPFVDYPGLEDYVWGDKKNETFYYDNYSPALVSNPTFSPASGTTFTESISVTISCSTSGASIYYTTDGTTPTANSQPYTSAITLTETTTLKAIAYDSENNASGVATATYTKSSGETPSGETIFEESFSISTATNNVLITSNNLSSYCDYNGWSTFTQVYAESGNCGRIGSSKNAGELTANNISLTSNAILTYKIKSYGSDSGKTISVSISGATATGDLTATGTSNWEEHTVNITGATGSISISFTGGRMYIDDIKLVTDEGVTPGKQDVSLSFSTSTATGTLGSSFGAPVLTVNPSAASNEVVYSSSDEDVAMVDASTGEVTLVGEGTVTITASITNSDNYNDASASYELTVEQKGETTEYTATFNFPENSYGMTPLSGSTNEYNPNPTTISSGDITLTMTGSNNSRYWQTNSSYELRVYKACTMTISAPENGKITQVVFAGSDASKIQYEGQVLTNKTWTGNQESVVFTFGDTQKINTINVTYEVETVEPHEAITLSVGGVGYATLYYGDKNLEVPAGVTAYTYKVSGGELNVSTTYGEGDIIPAGTGVILEAGAGDYEFIVSDEGGLFDEDNMLKGSDEETVVDASGYTYYILSNGTNGVGFYYGKVDGEDSPHAITNKAHKAYLAVPDEEAGAKTSFVFNETTTPLELVGTAHFAENFWFEDEWDVELYQSLENRNEFRIKNPFGIFADKGLDGNQSEWLAFKVLKPGDTVGNVTITKPDLVWFDDTNTGFFHSSYSADVWLLHPGKFTGVSENDFTHNRVLSYQENGLPGQVQLAPRYYMFGIGGWNQSAADGVIIISFPGYIPLDLEVEIEYSETLTNNENQVFAVAQAKLGKDATDVRAVVVSADADPAVVADAVVAGYLDATPIEAGRIEVPISEDLNGKLQIVIVVLYEGKVKNVVTVPFEYWVPGTNPWKNLGKGLYTEDFVLAAFGLDPVTYEVEIQENTETPGLYRMLSPYMSLPGITEEDMVNPSLPFNIEIDATNPDAVIIYKQPIGLDFGYGPMYICSWGAYMLDNNDFDWLNQNAYFGQVIDGTIMLPTFQRTDNANNPMFDEDGNPMIYQGLMFDDNGGYYAGSNGAFKIVLPEAIPEGTAIVAPKVHPDKQATYNLQGQRMNVNGNTMPKGIYITGGKKYVVR